MSTSESVAALPRKDLYRACFPACEMRGEFDSETPPTLHGHFAVFNSPTEINSMREGNFMESIAPGAFTKTFAENRSNIKVLFQHGRDPQIGDKPLGAISELREDDTGAYYEVELLDTSYNRDLLPGLRAGLYGASFRFQVMREDINKTPGESASNPRGIPERTVREAQVAEYGPVTFPAYKDSTAGVRSITDTIWDVDALAYAGAIILDDERMSQARIFVTRDIVEDQDEDEERKDFSTDKRKQLAKSGAALPDGSFPIVTVQDLQNAISAFGRASDKAAAKAHIIKRAKALGRTDLIPDDWKSQSNSEDPDGIVRAEDVDSDLQDAPPDDAEPSVAHLIRGRRENGSQYLSPREETPPWRLPSRNESLDPRKSSLG